jgi:peptidoglycan/LPS O-acetylase OafA/YrhL
VLGVCYAVSFVPYIFVVRVLQLDLWDTIGPRAFVLYNPLFHVHGFVAGMTLARLLELYSVSAKRITQDFGTVISYGASFGYGFIVLLILVDASTGGLLRNEYYLVWRNGGMMPIHALIIVGLALGVDPLAKVFSQSPLRRLGDLSYAIFVLQCPTFRAVTMWTINTGVNRYYVYPLILLAFAALAHHGFAQVFVTYLRLRRQQ